MSGAFFFIFFNQFILLICLLTYYFHYLFREFLISLCIFNLEGVNALCRMPGFRVPSDTEQTLNHGAFLCGRAVGHCSTNGGTET